MDIWVYGVGLVLGAIAILTACTVFLRKGMFGIGGGTLSLVGLLLVGMSVWSHAKIEVSSGGVKAEVEALQETVDQMAGASAALSEEVQTVARGTEATKEQLVQLTRNLENRQAIAPNVGNLERTFDAMPKTRFGRIDSATAVFKADRRRPPR